MSRRTLSEADSKSLLADAGVPMPLEAVVATADEAVAAAAAMGFPVVVKLCGDQIAHKTERGLVRLGLTDKEAVRVAALELLGAAADDDGDVGVLVAPMIRGARELIAGVVRDELFGPTLMFGIGGISAEVVGDVVFRPAPVDRDVAASMLDEVRAAALLGPFRGEPAVDRDALIDVLVALGDVAATRTDLVSVDVNPIVVAADGTPVVVDALVELDDAAVSASAPANGTGRRHDAALFEALFNPRGVLVAGVSGHPGKFGFVTLHNVLAAGYKGDVFGTNLNAEEVLGIRTVASVDELPDGVIDLVFVCTPASTVPDVLRACAAKGIRAAFLTSAGFAEAGDEGIAAQAEVVALADELGMLLVGPNGQGVVSTPADLCAQIVAPYPPRGRIGVASQSGNFVSSFLNMAVQTGVGISRAVSAGNAATVGVADLVEHYGTDPETTVALSYIEGIEDGAELMSRLGAVAATMPVVVMKGGATSEGARAAASHTGALAANDAVFDGACRGAGVTRAAGVEEAFEAAASFATQPLPAGPNVVVLTTAGGWGVVTADAIAKDGDLVLLELSDDLRATIDKLLPARWSRNNPVDCAGGERRDTIPDVLELVVRHDDVHAVVYLGIGIQSNQAAMMRRSRFYPGNGLERIVDYHERQDRRFADAAHDLSVSTGKPILTATELAVTDPSNAGPAQVRATGRLCYPTGERAVRALAHLWRYARHSS
ncbi:MAG: acetate--CoA ligase family protein [Acidimicrobiia bacterium]|nr:acetate--CoA ligase family protein [Acidimicrobiia bacterium]